MNLKQLFPKCVALVLAAVMAFGTMQIAYAAEYGYASAGETVAYEPLADEVAVENITPEYVTTEPAITVEDTPEEEVEDEEDEEDELEVIFPEFEPFLSPICIFCPGCTILHTDIYTGNGSDLPWQIHACGVLEVRRYSRCHRHDCQWHCNWHGLYPGFHNHL